jgi:hypothetical protein
MLKGYDQQYMIELMAKSRGYLDEKFKFGRSEAGIYAFERDTLLTEGPPAKLVEIMRASGNSEEFMNRQIRRYAERKAFASCFHTKREYEDKDYFVSLTWPQISLDRFFLMLIFGHEVMHGEHIIEHYRYPYKFDNGFSDIAAEFFGALGSYLTANGICEDITEETTTGLQVQIPAVRYEQKRNRIIVKTDDICNRIAADVFDKVEYDKLFHEPDERKMWAMINNNTVPNIRFAVPSIWTDKNGSLKAEIESFLKGLGLDSTVSFNADDSLFPELFDED